MAELSATERLAAAVISRGKVEALRKRGLRVVVECGNCRFGEPTVHGLIYCGWEFHRATDMCATGEPREEA